MAQQSGERASKTLSGELAGRPLAVLLAGAGERGTSGTFTFRHAARFDSLVMRLGKIAAVRTSDPIAYLGAILYDLGTIDMPTLNETLHEVARAKRLHGHVLLERGITTRDRLDEGLAEQTFRQVHHLFSLPPETTWSFREDADDLSGARDEDRPPIETWPAIWRGLRDHAPAPHVRRTLAKVEGGIHLRDLGIVARFGLTPEEMTLCERLNQKPCSLEHLIATSPLGGARTELLVYLLALARCIVRIETPPVGPIELGIEGVRDRARRIADQDAYTALGLRADASPEAARAAYFRLARLWHPNKIPPSLDEVRAECNRVFLRLGEAHRSISDVGPAPWHRADAVVTAAGGAHGAAANDSIAPPPIVRATMRDVDAALARRDVGAAETFASSLTSAGADGPSARAVIAWCAIDACASADTDPAALEGAIAKLDRVLTGDPECVRALFYRAQVEKRLGRVDAALRDYRRVVRLDPRHADAQRELHGLQRRTPAETGVAKETAASQTATESLAALESSVQSGLRRLLKEVARK